MGVPLCRPDGRAKLPLIFLDTEADKVIVTHQHRVKSHYMLVASEKQGSGPCTVEESSVTRRQAEWWKGSWMALFIHYS